MFGSLWNSHSANGARRLLKSFSPRIDAAVVTSLGQHVRVWEPPGKYVGSARCTVRRSHKRRALMHAHADPTRTQDMACGLSFIGPDRAAKLLGITASQLVELINDAELPAYAFGTHIRFRYRDVISLASRRAIAA